MEMTKYALMHLLGIYDFRQKEDVSFSQLQLSGTENPGTDTLYLTTQPNSQPTRNILKLSSLQQINEALRSHQLYLGWREQCLRLAYVEHDMNTLLDVSAGFLGWDLWIVTPDYWMDVGAVKHFSNHLQSNTRIPQAEVESLYQNNPNFDETFQNHGIHAYPQYPVSGAMLYYCNLFQENLYLGRLLIMIPKEHENPGALQLMASLCEDVENCYRFLYLHRRQKDLSYRFYTLWKALLEDQNVDPGLVGNALSQMGWNTDDEYQILYMIPTGYFYSDQTLKYYAVQLESTFPGCIATELNDGLYCLYNLSRYSVSNFRQKLSEFLRENLFRVGISNTFHDFFDSRRYRLQAEDAMHFGQKTDPSLWRYDFCDYVKEYTLSQCTAQYSARDLCPRNLQILLDYETKHPGGELMETLYQYYACQFNAQLAAHKLFIHRTTFFYRLNKIQKIAAFHPDDPDETCQIMLAFLALRKTK